MFRSIGFLLALLCPVRGKDIDVSWTWGCKLCGQTLKADIGDVVKFDQGFNHNVYTMVDATAYAGCNFDVGTNLGENLPVDVPIKAEDAGKTLYFGCEKPYHCQSGKMLIAIEVAPVVIDVVWDLQCENCRKTLQANVGEVVRFNQGWGHNVYTMVDATAYAGCDFTGGTNLGTNAPVDVTIKAEDAGKTFYFGCQVPGHCPSMKIAFEIAPLEKPKKKCKPKKTKKQKKMVYEHGKKKKEKKCAWLIRKSKVNANLKKKTCKKNIDLKSASKVCTCFCRK